MLVSSFIIAICIRIGRFGDMLHRMPWQTDHPFGWQRNANDALGG